MGGLLSNEKKQRKNTGKVESKKRGWKEKNNEKKSEMSFVPLEETTEERKKWLILVNKQR